MKIIFDHSDLRPFIQEVVDMAIERIDLAQAKLPTDRLAYAEPEAAALIGVAPHSLRDARLRGEVNASRCGKRTVYQRTELLKYLTRQKLNP